METEQREPNDNKAALENHFSWYDVELPLGEAAGTFDLEKAVCSHGLFMMAPNQWDPLSKSLLRPLRLSLPLHGYRDAENDAGGDGGDGESVVVRVSQPSDVLPRSLLLRVFGTRCLSHREQDAVVAQVRRMLRLSESEERKVREFQEMHSEAKKRGFGRVFRSPTLFEDMVKCILFCNCQWPRTLSMARALCELQLELQHLSSGVSSGEVDKTNSKTASLDAECFTPRTPSGKELKLKCKKRKISKVLWKEDAGAGNKFEAGSNSRIITHARLTNCSQMPENFVSSVLLKSGDKMDEPGTCCDAVDEKFEADEEVRELQPYPKIGNFPGPKEIASLDEKYLAKRCSLGYRAGRILKLAQGVVEGSIQLRQLEELCSDASLSNYDKVDEKLKEISGFGPFTCRNVLMCMGLYNVVPADSETIRHLKQVHSRITTTRTVQRVADEIYEQFAPFQFLAYWSELWNFYEEWFGRLSEMPSSSYELITASNMRIKRKLKAKDFKSSSVIESDF
ncbi:hypothetical protein Ancab_026470 [Ancistrocladus abbreviatus]